MKILVVTPYLPWPLNTGGNTAQFATLKCLKADHEFTVVSLLHSPKQRGDLEEAGRALPGVRFIGVDAWDMEPGRFSRNAAFLAARKIYRMSREALLQPGQPTALPYYPFNPLPAELIQILNKELQKGVDICQAEFAEMMPLGAWLPAEVPRVFIHHQIHFVYARRFIQAKGAAGGYGHFLEATIRAQETVFLKYFDTVVTFSQTDREILQPYLNGTEVVTSPFPLPPDVETKRETRDKFSGAFSFIASEAHDPNRDALEWLLEEIWPRIAAALPGASLNIIGEWSEKRKNRLTGAKINFTGYVKDLSSVMDGSVLLVPLRIGSGIRVKILTAQALGTPVVTTQIGTEGIEGADGKELLIRDTAESFAAAAVELANEPALWKRLSMAGREAVVRNYSPESVRARRNEIYGRLWAKRKGAED
jgi:glycosyltransferase involved in cell wall biosynthesis